MSLPPGTRVLLITPLDFASRPNNSEHNRAAQYRDRGHRVTVLYKTMNASSRFLDMVRDTVRFRVDVEERDGLRLVGVDPLFNYFAGYRRNVEAKSAASPQNRFSLRLILVRLLSPLSVLRDAFFLPCFLAAVRWKTGDRFEVCLGVGPWGGLVGWALKVMGRVSTLVYIDRDLESGLVPDRLRRSYTEAVERFGIRRADVWVCVSHLLAERRRRSVDRDAHIIPNGVGWELYESSRRAARNGHRLVYVGNVISWSGVEIAIKALPRIRQEFPDAALRIVGGGLSEYLQYLQRLTDELDVGDAVEWLGERPQVALSGILGDAEIGLSNSQPVLFRRYACPIKVMEYMSAGLPVIATTDTEAADMVCRFGCGVGVSYDVDSFAQAVLSLFRDPERYATMGLNGIEHSRTLTWSAVIDRELDLIVACRSKTAAGEHGPDGCR